MVVVDRMNAGDTIGDVSVAGQMMDKWWNTYFGGRFQSGHDHGPGRFNGKTHSVLADSDRVFQDAGVVIRELSIEHFLWVNSAKFMPTRLTDKLEHEITVLHFDDPVMPEQVPAEAVSRYFEFSREKTSFRSQRYGVAMYFELDRMLTEEGRMEFAMNAKRIALAFRMHAAYVALCRFLAPNDSEQRWFSQYNTNNPATLRLQHIKTEVDEFAEPHKQDSGAFALIWRYAQLMERKNG